MLGIDEESEAVELGVDRPSDTLRGAVVGVLEHFMESSSSENDKGNTNKTKSRFQATVVIRIHTKIDKVPILDTGACACHVTFSGTFHTLTQISNMVSRKGG